MKLNPLPMGMVVTEKYHMGRNLYKIKLIKGFIRSNEDGYPINICIIKDVSHHHVTMEMDIDYSFRCTGCFGLRETTCELVMN